MSHISLITYLHNNMICFGGGDICVINTARMSLCLYKRRQAVNIYGPSLEEYHSSDLRLFAL